MDRPPKHVGLIMDGNRRWANLHKKTVFDGHSEGTLRIEPIVDASIQQGIQVLSFWAFSTENWNREESEVKDLLHVFRRALKDPLIDRLQKNGVRVGIIGDLHKFPKDIEENVEKIIIASKNNTRITVNFALNYGGRDEIVRAYAKAVKDHPQSITKEEFSRYLDTAGQPDLDFLIRTGGEKRTSGFLPYQSDYAELHFVDILWPEFTKEEYSKSLEEYSNRQRRFGK